MRYHKVYHDAHAHIIAYGGHRYSEQGRWLVAVALRILRAMHKRGEITAQQLQWERDHFRYVGHPVKEVTP